MGFFRVVPHVLAKRGEYASAYGAELRSPSSRLPQYKCLAALGHNRDDDKKDIGKISNEEFHKTSVYTEDLQNPSVVRVHTVYSSLIKDTFFKIS